MKVPISKVDISSFSFSQNPYPYYEEMMEIAPIHYLEYNQRYIILSYKLCSEVLQNPKVFSSKVNSSFDPVLLGADAPEHTLKRKRLEGRNGPFSKIRIDQLEGMIRRISEELIDAMLVNRKFDFIHDFAAMLPSLVIMDVLGIYDNTNGEMLREWTRTAVSNSSIHEMEFAEKHWRELEIFIRGFVQKCKNQPRKGMISELIHDEADGYQFNDDELVYLSKILLVGGNETTPNLMGNVLYEALEDSSLLDELKRAGHIQNIVKESMRKVAPTQMVHRMVVEDTQLDAWEIPKGALVAVCLGAAQRDEAYFTNSAKHDSSRSGTKQISFGLGAHHCIGSRLAVLEACIGIEVFMKKVPNFYLACAAEKLEYRHSSHVRGLVSLPLSLDAV